MALLWSRIQNFLNNKSFKQALILFIVLRLFLSFWAIVSLTINPLPEGADEVVRPYLGEPQLTEGISGLLLGPWQRFDTLRYMNIARQGYADERNSVFPPLYPLAVGILGDILGGGGVNNLVAGIILSNLACLAFFIFFHRVVSQEYDPGTATRSLIYLAFFPTGFFLIAPYTEPIFMLFALGSLWAGRNGRFWLAGGLGFLASLTRLTGWIMVIPLAYEYYRQHLSNPGKSKDLAHEQGLRTKTHNYLQYRLNLTMIAIALPGIGLGIFILWRWWIGLPPLGGMYTQYWHQRSGFPGIDLIAAVQTLFFGGIPRNNEIITLSLDFAATILLIISTILSFRRLGITYGLYSGMLLLFILLPTSDVKPLYSFSRYTLVFFPTFMLLGLAGKNSIIHRGILYPFFLMYLYFSGQFFVWGWVA